MAGTSENKPTAERDKRRIIEIKSLFSGQHKTGNYPLMKKTGLLILSGLLLFFVPKAQQSAEAAFSKSYTFEYEAEYGKAIAALTELKTENYQIDLRLGWLYYL